MRLRILLEGRWRLYAVCRDRGDCPFTDFLADLPSNLKATEIRLQALFRRVAEGQGPPRNTDVSHQLSDDIWEFIQGRLRVLWFYDEGRVIVVSHAFVKKRQKTPAQEIARAEEARARYRAAKATQQLIYERD